MAIKMRHRQQQEELQRSQLFDGFGLFSSANDEQLPLHMDWDLVDVPLLQMMCGRDISYDELGMIPEEFSAYPRPKSPFTTKDMEQYELQSDLFWWFCKMDVYQSILGGTRLL
jgi:hypothetical protein